MLNNDLRRKCVLVLVACCSFFRASSGIAACIEPTYEIGRDFSNQQLGLVALHLSVSERDLSVERLACLAEHLRVRNPHWRQGSVLIFGSITAARDFVGGVVEVPYAGRPSNSRQQMAVDAFWDTQRQLRATYAFDFPKGQQSLTISPFGTLGAELGAVWDSTFQLPLEKRARCRLEIGDRCVMSIGTLRDFPIPYPVDALRTKTSGSVTVRAILGRNGSITMPRVVGSAAASLVRGTLESLKTWRTEPGPRDRSIEITYVYRIDPSLAINSPQRDQRHVVHATGGELDVVFDLPNRITINGFPRMESEK